MPESSTTFARSFSGHVAAARGSEAPVYAGARVELAALLELGEAALEDDVELDTALLLAVFVVIEESGPEYDEDESVAELTPMPKGRVLVLAEALAVGKLVE